MEGWMNRCTLCPRRCGADRTVSVGRCGVGEQVRLARAALHFWEEPCVSGEEGSGTVFFSGCSLGCVFCQNYQISAGHFGRDIPVERLAEIFLELQEQKANNINLVTGGHYIPQIVRALDLVRGTDLKYRSPERGARYSHAPDYFAVASKAILEMFDQVGPVRFDGQGMIQKGLIVRHMVMPNGVEDSMDILTWIAGNLPLDDILVSVMSQYTPFYRSGEYPEIDRRLTAREYDRVLDWLDCMGIENGFVQELSSAKEEYTPDFSLQGV